MAQTTPKRRRQVDESQTSAEYPRYTRGPATRTVQQEIEQIESWSRLICCRIRELPAHGYMPGLHQECRGLAERLQAECDEVLTELRGMIRG